jgi:hypothetical protein
MRFIRQAATPNKTLQSVSEKSAAGLYEKTMKQSPRWKPLPQL